MNKRSLFFFLLLLTGCFAKKDDYEFDFEDQKLVVWGELALEEVAKVYVSKTLKNPFEGGSDFLVEDPTVILFENMTLVDTLFFSSDGSYSSTITIKENKDYHLQVFADGFESVSTAKVRVPDDLHIIDTTKWIEVGGMLACGSGDPRSLDISWSSLQSISSFYELEIDGLCGQFDFMDGNLDCIFQAATSRKMYLADNCFPENSIFINCTG